MDRYRNAPDSRGVTASSRGALAFAFVLGLSVIAVPTLAGPAAADIEDCNGEVVERNGILVCVGGDEDPGDPGNPDEPAPEPEEGDTRTGYKYEVCQVDNPNPSEENPGCGGEVQCEGDDEPTNVYSRPEVYHRAQGGWVWTGGGEGNESGDGWWYVETICNAPQEYVPTEADVWRAVRQLAFPGAEAQIQPPNGRTLVDLDTNFYTDSPREWGPRDLQVGEATVQVRATVQEYHWDFGDGSSNVTTSPGAPYPDKEIVHAYGQTGSFTPSVTLMYHVEWQYDGNGWAPFDDLLPASASPTTDLQVVEKINRLVD